MDNRIAYAVLLALLLSSSIAIQAGGRVTVNSPVDGAVVKAGQVFRLAYEASSVMDGDYLRLNVDGAHVNIIHPLKGTVEIDPLPSGKHKVCLVISTQPRAQTGAGECINIISK